MKATPVMALAGALLALATTPPLFREAAEETGLRFVHVNGGTGQYYLPEIMGPGAALLDYDGDGDLDAYLLQGGPLGDGGAAEPPTNRLFRNERKDGAPLRFTDVTAAAGVGDAGYGMGAAVGDYDGDGDLDLYVTNFGPNVLYRNNGDGTFADVTAEAGVGDGRWNTSAAFLDYDRDGDLDLFVLAYIDFTVAGNKRCFDAGGAPDYCNPNLYRPLPDRLFANQGDGRFRDVSEQAGITAAVGPGLGVTCADLDGDGWQDVYVANDGAANHLWINRRDGTFSEEALLAGAAFNAEGAPEGSMGVAAGDFDGDGDEDLFMTHLNMESNTLYVNDGAALFQDVTAGAGLAHTSLAFTGFGTEFFDYDQDGRLDLFSANGAVRNLESARDRPYPYDQRNQLFHNQGDSRFLDVTETAGPAFQLSEVSRGAALGDVDGDGDLDVLVGNNRGPARLLLNEAAAGNWLQIELRSPGANRFALGARVGLVLPSGRTLWRRVRVDGSYLSSSDPRVHFGLGSGESYQEARVHWPDGSREGFPGGSANTVSRLQQGAGAPLP